MYHELIIKIALETIKRHGYEVQLDSDAYEKNPVIRRYFSDATKALETVDQFLSDNGVTFSDLNVSSYRPQPQKPSEPDQVFPTWEQLGEWVEKLYKFWHCDASDRFLVEQYELDKQEALRAYMTPDQMVEFYNHLASNSARVCPLTAPTDLDKLALEIVRLMNPHLGKIEVKLYFNDAMICVGGKCCDHWATSHGGNYTREIACVIPQGLNPIEMSLTEILSYGKDAPIELFTAPKTQPAEPVKPATKPAEESRCEQYKKGKLLEVQLYFDSSDTCLGVHSKNFVTSYKGMFAYSWAGYIKAGLNPIGEHIINILGPSAADDFKRSHEPRYTHPKELKKSERELMQCFVGREIEFERFLAIKKYLLTVEGMKVGALISNQDDIKAWFVTAGKDKAALYFTSWDGWEIDTRQDQEELTGVFEDFDLIQALDQNDIEVNGISASDWHNARCEKAEAEAVALQHKERAKAQSN